MSTTSFIIIKLDFRLGSSPAYLLSSIRRSRLANKKANEACHNRVYSPISEYGNRTRLYRALMRSHT
ncbi:hypothetical protein O181_005166 [Austropuccinia psidii MF-1]|uniref:Uncharacterized protein n=1 Tax=Austropuccinia psidii MF-1 TaxID=1389203 RepID=A0A9Q3BGT5_9BASI|nr:hypothetical protein [Austropuccinia psidii MF-1]